MVDFIENNPAFWGSHWHQLFFLLSLDCVFIYWEVMGLNLEPKEKERINENSRIAYERYQAGKESYYEAGATLEMQEEIIVSFFNNIQKELGEDTLIIFKNWAMHYCYFDQPKNPYENSWIFFFRFLKNNYKNNGSKYNIKDETLKKIIKIYDKEMDEAYEELAQNIEKIDKESYTEWDKRVILSHGYKEYDTGLWCEADPFDIVLNFSNHAFFKKFWREINNVLGEEMKGIITWFKDYLAERKEK